MSAENPHNGPEQGKGDGPQRNHKKSDGSDTSPKEIAKKRIPENPEGERMRLAGALIKRDAQENKWIQRIMKLRAGIDFPYEEPTNLDAQVEYLAGFLNKTETTDVDNPVDTYLQGYFDRFDEELLAEGLLSDLEQFENVDAIKDLARRKAILGNTLLGDSNFDMLLRSLDRATAIAAEYNVSRAEVFERDDLYEELMRKQYETPEDLARSKMSEERRVRPDLLREMSVIDMTIQEIISGKSPSEAREQAEEQLSHPQATAKFDQMAEELNKTKCIIAGAMIERLWGEDAIEQLDPEIQRMFEASEQDTTNETEERSDEEAIELIRDLYKIQILDTIMKPFSNQLRERVLQEPELVHELLQKTGQQAEFVWRVQAISTAREIANDHHVGVGEVYETPELFSELQQRHFSPETFALVELRKMEEFFSEDNIREYKKLLHLLTQTDAGKNVEGQEELLEMFYETEQGKAEIQEEVKNGRTQWAQATEQRISELWGENPTKEDTPKPAERIQSREYSSRAAELYDQEEFAEALSYAQRAVELTPDSIDSWNVLGEIQHSLAQWEEAAHSCEQILSLIPEDQKAPARILRNYGDTLDELEREGEALSYLTQAIEAEPENPLNWDLRGYIQIKLGDYESALADYEQVVSLSPENPLALQKLRNIQIRLGKWGDAAASSEKILTLTPEKAQDAAFLDNYAFALDEIGRNEEALHYQTRAIKLEPENPTYWNNRGAIHEELENYEQAIVDYSQAIAVEDKAFYRANRGKIYYELQEYEQAAEDFYRAKELEPEHPTHTYNYGYLQAELGNYDIAEEEVTKAIELADKAYYRAGLGEIQYKRRNYREAEQNLQQSIAMDETDPEPYYYLALTQEQLGKTEEVRDLLEKAQTLAQGEEDQKVLKQIQEKLQGM